MIGKNEYLIHDGYAEIIIISDTYGRFNAKIDKSDVEKCADLRWGIRKAYGRRDGTYYIGGSKGGSVILLHRFILDVTSRDEIVDHINGDTLDCRRENMRVCDHNKNAMNKRHNKLNTSGRKGVVWYYYNGLNKWMAYIRVNKKLINLGYYENFDDAAKAREEAEERYFGEFNRN